MAERTNFKAYLLYSVFITGLVYPVVVSWQWGGGWLAERGFVDFAGSGLVHMTGGVAALMGAIALGPRIGKFGPDGKPRAIPGHSIPLAITGVFVLLIGWFGFNPGSQLAADLDVPAIAVKTLLAGAAGAAAAMFASWVLLKKPDVSMAGNGMLAGLVAICSGVGVGAIDLSMTVLTGAIAGVIVVAMVLAVERILKVDDPVGAFALHGVCGFWGLLATGLLAEEGGLFFGGGSELFFTQLIGGLAIAAFVAVTTGAVFFGMKSIGFLRVTAEEEIAGLDVHEHGAPGYGPDILAGGLESFSTPVDNPANA
jgi:Amt family ammonium transporter